jgi:hypothetical protein
LSSTTTVSAEVRQSWGFYVGYDSGLEVRLLGLLLTLLLSPSPLPL